MTGQMDNPPSEIVRQLLVDLGHGTDPVDGSDWPCFNTGIPDSPDKLISVETTGGRVQGRSQSTGTTFENPTFQVTVRTNANDLAAGYKKAKQIAVAFDEDVLRTEVQVTDPDSGTNTYKIQAVSRITDVVDAGYEKPATSRRLYTVNAVMSVRQIAGTGT